MRSTLLIWAARLIDFLQGKRRNRKTFDDLRALGLLNEKDPAA
jgi:hypothetical protein